MKNKEEGSIARTLAIARRLLTPAQKRKGIAITLLTVVSSFVEVFGLATLVPVVVACAEPGIILKNKYFLWAYNALHFQSERNFLVAMLLSVVFFFVLKSLFTTWVSYVQSIFTAQVVYAVTRQQLEKNSSLNYATFNDLGSGRLLNSSLTISGSYLNALLRPLINMFTEVVVALTIVVGLVLYNPILIVILVAVLVPPMMLTYRLVRGRTQYIQSRSNALWTIAVRHVSEMFTGFIELRLARRQQHAIDNVMRIQSESYWMDTKNFVYTQIPQKVIELAAILGVVIIMVYSLTLGDATTGLVGLIGLFAASAYRLMPSFNRILTSVVQLRSNQHVLDDIEGLQGPDAQEPVDAVQQPLHFKHELNVKNLSFGFKVDGRLALDNININIRKGEKIGFIGSSGSGKTTLMNILLRFYKEQQGQILVDGVPLGSNNIDGWHQIIGYVKQDTFLMDASIKDNITLGETDPDPQRLAYAVDQASLTALIENLPEGLDTFIGERGSKISGGQRQRIGIARAMYKQTQILILDEATSALDNETEREVSEAINHLSQGDLTILIVAHRLTTLRECDRVYELDHGKLVAEHQYEALLERIK